MTIHPASPIDTFQVIECYPGLLSVTRRQLPQHPDLYFKGFLETFPRNVRG